MPGELTSRNNSLRGGKGSLYEGGIRIPLLVQWKSKLPPGKTYDHPVISADVVATASAAAGLDLPRDRWMDSVDLVSHLTGRKAELPHGRLSWHMGPRGALRKGDWMIVLEAGRRGSKPRIELFCLDTDIGETENPAGDHPDKLHELLTEWERLDAEMVDPVWTPRKL